MKVTVSIPKIEFNKDLGPVADDTVLIPSYAGCWQFADRGTNIAAVYQVGIFNLSATLAELRSFCGFRLPEGSEPNILVGAYNHQSLSYNLFEVLDCFAPSNLNNLSAAILKGDEEAFEEHLNNYSALDAPIIVKDKSFLLTNTYIKFTEKKKVWIYDRHDQDKIANFDWFRMTFLNGGVHADYNALKNKLVNKQLTVLGNDQEFSLSPFLLAVLSKQRKFALKLLPAADALELQAKVNDKLNFFDVLWVCDPMLILEYLPTQMSAILASLIKMLPHITGKQAYNNFFTSPCPLSTKDVVAQLTTNSNLYERTNKGLDKFLVWMFSNVDLNLTINERDENIIFLLFRMKALHVCSLLINKYDQFNLTKRNSDGNMPHQLADERELLLWPTLLDSLLSYAEVRNTFAYLRDYSELLIDAKYHDAVIVLIKYNPQFLITKNNASILLLDDCKYHNFLRYKVMPFLKNKYPRIFIECALKLSLLFNCFDDNWSSPNISEQRAQENIEKIKLYLAQNQLENLVREVAPDVFEKLYPPKQALVEQATEPNIKQKTAQSSNPVIGFFKYLSRSNCTADTTATSIVRPHDVVTSTSDTKSSSKPGYKLS